MNYLFGGRELGFLVGGGSRMELIYKGRGRERRQHRTGRRRVLRVSGAGGYDGQELKVGSTTVANLTQ